jgi:TonB family protein
MQEYRGACSREQDLLQPVRKDSPAAVDEIEKAWTPHPQERLATIEAHDAFMQELEAGDYGKQQARARFLERPSPRFPAWAARETETGSVTAQLYVGADGTVAGVKILSAEPAGYFELAALRALLRWRLEPTGAGYKASQRLDFVLPPKAKPSGPAKKKAGT